VHARARQDERMSGVPPSWAAQRLAEFLSSTSRAADEAGAVRSGLECAAAAFDADLALVLGAGRIVAAIGEGADELEAESVGALQPCLAVPIEDERLSSLVVVRGSGHEFNEEERNLARGMARALGLSVRLLRVVEAEQRLRALSERQRAENDELLASLEERRRLVERLSKIQGSIVRRRDLSEVLDAIVAGALDLLGDDTVALRLIDPDDPKQLIMVASAGVDSELVRAQYRTPVGLGAGGRAVSERELVLVEDYQGDDRALAAFAGDGIRAALAAPVREGGEIVGSLVVATHREGRHYSEAERDMLLAFAEHASLALTDARTVGDAIHQAFHDTLTELPNRLLLMDRLEHALARAARARTSVAVLFIDLDTFKNVNDSLGHGAGDVVLREAAKRLLSCVRNADTAARFGGDEFVVLIEDVDEHRVARVANRILEAMNDPFEIDGRHVVIGASIGIAVGSDEADDLLRNADLALYRAKSKGKGQKQVYEPEMHVAVVQRLELEESLSKALRHSEMVLHYQPIVDLRTQRMAGVEALVRWEHPGRGLLLPGEFIPVAEDSRLMVPLGRWVLERACVQAAEWRERHEIGDLLTLSVNLSSTQFADASLIDKVSGALASSGLPPERLVLELTETAFLHDPEAVGELMARLKRLGVRLAVDDFGTGNASLRHLARLPIDVIKVDRSFVDRIGIDRRQTAITASIISLGESLGMAVVAEGIESEDQVAQLLALGCDLGQGFHLARPQPAADLDAALAREPRAIPGGRFQPASLTDVSG
jgi:diguanylate cyclase (GGDEF)-like protein